MLQVRENEISLRNSSSGPEYLRTQGEHCWRCNANGRQNALSFLHYNEMPHVTVTITKNTSLAAIARYISITTIYTVGYLQIFNAGHFFSSMHCHDLERKKHWIAMVFNETQIMTLFYLTSRAAPSWCIHLN